MGLLPEELMKIMRIFLLCVFSSGLLYASSYSAWANAPETAKIVFTSSRDGNNEIYTMNPDGSESINLTRHPADDHHPVWSPTGEQILFVSNKDGLFDLYLMDADGSHVRKVFKTLAERSYPTWAPDGEKIAYVLINEKRIYTARIDGTEETALAETGRIFHTPAWSPDGTEIVFPLCPGVPGPKGFPGIPLVFITPHGKMRGKLHPEPDLQMQSPAWSPSGDRIAFTQFPWVADELNQQTVYIVNRDGNELQQILPKTDLRIWEPAWSPHGNEILYGQEVENQVQLFKINLSNHTKTQLTHNGSNSSAEWFDPLALPVQPQVRSLITSWGELKQK